MPQDSSGAPKPPVFTTAQFNENPRHAVDLAYEQPVRIVDEDDGSEVGIIDCRKLSDDE